MMQTADPQGKDRSYFVGFDPGGLQAFGWAVMTLLGPEGQPAIVASGLASSADEAIESTLTHLPTPPSGVGIDAPLFWARRGDRAADARIREAVCREGGQSGTVNHVNSLRGACIAQGAIAAEMAGKRWPVALITEAHPKALLIIDAGAAQFLRSLSGSITSEHERDAFLGAYSAWRAVEADAGWRDLAAIEREAFFPAGQRVSYWFPVL